MNFSAFDNATRTLTLEHNDATETLVQIPHTSTPNVDNLVKNVTWDANSRNLTIEKNSIHQTNSVLNIAEADLTNYYTQSQIDAKEFMEKHQEIEPGKIKIQNNEKCCWDDHSNKGLWMQDSTWVRFNARIYTESNHIATQGRIGAGTTNPGQPLHVAGKAYISSGMHVAGAYWSNNYTDSQSDYLTNGGSVGNFGTLHPNTTPKYYTLKTPYEKYLTGFCIYVWQFCGEFWHTTPKYYTQILHLEVQSKNG